MVLQRQKTVPIWGWGDKGNKITVSFNNQVVSSTVNNEGKWMVKLNPMQAGGPFKMIIKDKKSSIEIKDVLIGEVWICSGQSNMEFTVDGSDNAAAEIRSANFPQIRHYKVKNELSLKAENDLKIKGDWQITSPETVGKFTAVGYFFAKKLNRELNVPIGLINTSWGGSQVEGWISKEGLSSSDEFKNYIQQIPDTWEKAEKSLDEKMKQDAFGNKNISLSIEDEKKYTKSDLDISKWMNSYAPGLWDWIGIWAFRGQGYMARSIDILPGNEAKKSVLAFGENDSQYQLFINGRLISEGQQKGNRKIELPGNTFKSGKNILMIKQGAHQNPDWYGMGIHGPQSETYIDFNGEKILLAGDGWKMLPSIAYPYKFARLQNNLATTIYNAMLHPLVPYAFQGVIWYQGEANASRAYQYRKSFPLLINDWRNKWKDEFPFLYVQLTSFGSDQNSNQGSNWAELREAQTMTLNLPKTGMAVITDIGDPKDIHPTNKFDVGIRLAANALKTVYNRNLTFCGPMFESVSYESNKAVLSFKYTGEGLIVKDKYGYLKGFEIAGEDKIFYYAKAEISGNKVIVSSDKVLKPVSVRYGWTNSPIDDNLYNVEGFPTCPFRTDNWKGITDDVKFK